ncbi:hypothetical protein Dsin_012225 [Dipteronia sinensis]|uniref:MULE transposase domain-containing protein n=1 Tax=Dipteronia sinensis TaxID=43782 RepID=A0AAE0AIB8_9ROSI|nr:hypothetical protein Dsin_012225 [Dipteronia sinensis]
MDKRQQVLDKRQQMLEKNDGASRATTVLRIIWHNDGQYGVRTVLNSTHSIKRLFEDRNQGPIYKGHIFKDKKTLKRGFRDVCTDIEVCVKVIRLVIIINATHLKAKTNGVLLVVACKDENGMVYPLTFGFANSECIESWTWFLSQLSNVTVDSKRVMIVSDQHIGIIGGMA